MVVIAILAIFLVLALPSFTGTIQRYRVSMAATQVTNALQLARADAIRSRQIVAVAPTSAASAAESSCTQDGTGLDWHCGIDLYEDTNANGVQDTDPSERTFKTVTATSLAGVNVQLPPVGGAGTQLAYTPLGYLSACSAGSCSSSLSASGFDGLIYIWPTVLGNTPSATVPVISTVCASVAGKVKVVASYVATVAQCNG
jgi:Tfp pilus assembly protein FimT